MNVKCLSFSLGSEKVNQSAKHGSEFVKKTGIPFTFKNIKEPLNFIEDEYKKISQHFSIKNVDALIHVTQSQYYSLPNDASVLHDRLNLNKNILSITINQGCSGFVQALLMANSMLESYKYKKILIITNDWYTNYIDYSDRATSAIFSDGVAFTLVTDEIKYKITNQINYTDGSGWKYLFKKNNNSNDAIFMDGLAVYNFTKNIVINKIIKENINPSDLKDCAFYIHQASNFVLNEIYKIIPKKYCFTNLEQYGNTISSTIPILLNEFPLNEKKVYMLGFGG